jgi:hypothetical protein
MDIRRREVVIESRKADVVVRRGDVEARTLRVDPERIR